MKVSIAITAYNTEKYIEKAIESILNQTYKDFELILLDDGSTDHTGEIIDKYKDYKNVRVYHQENKGIPYSKSKCVELSRGEYIVIFDSDDIAENTLIEKEVRCFEQSKNKNVGIVYSDAKIINEYDDITRESYVGKLNRMSKNPTMDLIFFPPYPMSSMMYKKEVFNKIGLYDSKYSVSSDYDLMIRMSEHFTWEYIDEKLIRYRRHENNISRMGNIQMLFNLRDMLIKYSNLFEVKNIPRTYVDKSISIITEGYETAINAEDFQEKKMAHEKVMASLNIYGVFSKLKHEGLCKNNKVDIFGYGLGGQLADEAAHFFGLEIENIYDNSGSKQGLLINNRKIKLGEELKYKRNQNCIVITSVYGEEISQQLESYGYEPNKDYFRML